MNSQDESESIYRAPESDTNFTPEGDMLAVYVGPKNAAYSPKGDGCSFECRRNQAYCGDGVRNGPEQCDDGEAGNDGSYGGCNPDCTRAPYCGDNIVQDANEKCDDGPTGSFTCTQTCKPRDILL